MFVWCNDSNEYQALLVIPTRHIILRTLNASMFPASKLLDGNRLCRPSRIPDFYGPESNSRMAIIQQTQSSNLGPDRASFFSMSAGNHGL